MKEVGRSVGVSTTTEKNEDSIICMKWPLKSKELQCKQKPKKTVPTNQKKHKIRLYLLNGLESKRNEEILDLSRTSGKSEDSIISILKSKLSGNSVFVKDICQKRRFDYNYIY